LELISLLPHGIRLLAEDGAVIQEWPATTTAPAGVIWDEEVDILNGLPLVRKQLGRVRNLPEPQDGVGYLVRRDVALALRGLRDDVFHFDGMVMVDRKVQGARRLAQFPASTDD
jgi:hypothetical protein